MPQALEHYPAGFARSNRGSAFIFCRWRGRLASLASPVWHRSGGAPDDLHTWLGESSESKDHQDLQRTFEEFCTSQLDGAECHQTVSHRTRQVGDSCL